MLFPNQFSGVGLTLNSMTLTNNSVVTSTDIGTGSAALLCTTTYRPCCNAANPETQWYFPNGTQVPNNPALPYQRTRRRDLGAVILNRNYGTTTTGMFHCDIPDDNGVLRSLYVGIYDSTTGESRILCVFAWSYHYICKEVSGTPIKDTTFQVLVYVYLSSAYHICVQQPH